MILDGLDRHALKSRAAKLRLRNAGNLEKLAADLDAHSAISQVADCHVRGGLCTPFHVAAGAQRISVDIDMYTPEPMARMAGMVPAALKGGRFTSVTPMATRPGMPISHLVRFVARFDSHFGVPSPIYVDVACDMDMGTVDTVTVPAGHPVLGFRTERDVSALSRGSLIADKIPSLGIGTVGYRSLRSTPKQIYDVGTLLQHSGVDDLESALSTYAVLTSFKLARDSRGHGLKDVTQSIVGYLEGIGRTETSPDAERHWEDFGKFSAGMLSEPRRGRADHEERILLCLLLARSLAGSIEPGASCSDEAAGLHAALGEASDQKESGNHIAFLRKTLGMPTA